MSKESIKSLAINFDTQKEPKSEPLFFWIVIGVIAFVVYFTIKSSLDFKVIKEDESKILLGILLALFVYVIWSLWKSLREFRFEFIRKHQKTNTEIKSAINGISNILPKIDPILPSDNEFVKQLKGYVSALDSFSRDLWPNRLTTIHEIYRNQELERIEEFADEARRYLIRFVRLGILGTFVGLGISFLLMGAVLSSGDVDETSLAPSLTGYAVAVMLSIVANAIGIYYELHRVQTLRKVHILNWIDDVYRTTLEGGLFGKSPVLASDSLSKAIDTKLTEILDELKKNGNGFIEMINRLRDRLGSIIMSVEEIGKSLNDPAKPPSTLESVNNLKTQVNSANAELTKINDALGKSKISEQLTGWGNPDLIGLKAKLKALEDALTTPVVDQKSLAQKLIELKAELKKLNEALDAFFKKLQ